MSNKERILSLAAELKAAAMHHKELQQKAAEARASRSTLWRKRRSTLMEIEGLGGFKEAGYETFAQFCQQELGDRDVSVYSAELTMGYFETVVFEVPVCTYDRNFFTKTNCYPGGFSIRRSRGAKWEFVPEEIERAKAAWNIAKKLAAKSQRELPDRNDMGMAVAEVIGKEFEPHFSPLEKARHEIEVLERKLTSLEEAQTNADLTSYLNKQKEIYRRIELHCQSSIQKNNALELLIVQGYDEAQNYLNTLITNKYRRRAA